MAMNFQALMQMKTLWQRFTNNHPKFPAFLRAVQPEIREGSVLSISVKNPEGKMIESNLKVTASDIELIEAFKQIGVIRKSLVEKIIR